MADDPFGALFGARPDPKDAFNDVFGAPEPRAREVEPDPAILGGLGMDTRKPRNAVDTTLGGRREAEDVLGVRDVSEGTRKLNARRAQREADADIERRTIRPDGTLDYYMEFAKRGVQSFGSGINRTTAIVLDSLGANELADEQRRKADIRADRANLIIEGETTGDEVWANPTPKNIANFMLETGVQSTPEMFAAIASIPLYVAAMAGRTAQTRAENNGETEAGLADLVAAVPASVLSAYLDRLPLQAIFKGKLASTAAGRVVTGGGVEGITEFAQSGVEYLGGTLGTDKGANGQEMFKEMVLGAVAGTGMGAGLAGGVEAGKGAAAGVGKFRERTAFDNMFGAPEGPSAGEEAVRALDPSSYGTPGDTRPNIPLTASDRESALPDDAIQAGKNIMADALGERPQRTPPRPTAPIDARAAFQSRVRGVESGGNDQAKNPLSSATGRYQFTKGTWEGLGGDWSQRNDVGEQERLMAKLTDQNEAALRGARVPLTAGNYYLAHFAGSGGAVALHRNPGAPVEQTLGAAVVKANPFLAGMTGSDVIAWASKKMGGPGGAAGVGGVPDTDYPASLQTDAAAAPTESAAGMLERVLGEDILEPKANERVEVTQGGKTVAGTVDSLWDDNGRKGVRVNLDDGTTFDEALDDAREYGARITRPVDRTAAPAPVENTAPAMTEAAARAQTDPALDWDSSERDVRAGLLRKAGLSAALSRKVAGASFAEMAPDLQAKVGAELRKGYAEPAKDINYRARADEIADAAYAADQRTGTMPTGETWTTDENGWIEVSFPKEGYTYPLAGARDQGPLIGKQPGPFSPKFVRKEVKAPKAPKAPKPVSVMAFVRKLGGIKSGRHDLRNMGAIGRYPGVINNKRGFDVDEVGRALHEAGYFTGRDPSDPDQRPTEAETLEFLSNASIKPAFKVEDQPEQEIDDDEQLEQMRSALSAEIEDAGYSFNDDEMADAVRYLESGLSVQAAVEAAMDDAAGRVLEIGADETGDDFYDTIKDSIYEGDQPEERGGSAEEAVAGSPRVEGDAPRGDAPDAQPNAENQEGVAPERSTSTAPEHAAVGVDDRELSEVVNEFASVLASQGVGDQQVTHVFDPPKKGEVVRLAERTRVYTKDKGWMTPAEAKAEIAKWKAHAEAQGETRVNSQKIVLSLFDYTGAWSQPWEDAGYQVYRFDIQNDPDMGDVNNFSTEFFGDWFGDFEGQDIHAILAACPCTDFASSGARHFAAKDKDGRTVASVKLIQQTLATIEYFKPAVWAVENPVGRIEKLGGLPPWRLSFDPNDLGDSYTKKTLLWGRFNADLPIAPVEPTEGSKMWSQYGGKSMATKNARSATPEGFSYGFFMANNAVDHPAMAVAGKYDRLDRKLIERAIAEGVTPAEIGEAVDDFYYMELDDDSANAAIEALIAEQDAPPSGRNARDVLVRFASGMSRTRDLLSGAYSLGGSDKMGVGVDVGELSAGGIAAMARAIVDWNAKLFVDSGAFTLFKRNMKNLGEFERQNSDLFERGAEKPEVEALDFDAILERYQTIMEAVDEADPAEEVGDRGETSAMFVMPDVVGDQAASLDLVTRYARWIKTQATSTSFQPIVPLQKGELTLEQAFEQIAETLGTRDFIVGVPSNEAAVTTEEFRAFAKAAKPARLHFLGAVSEKKLGPKMDALQNVLDADPSYRVDHVSADANILRSTLYAKGGTGDRDADIRGILGGRDDSAGSRNTRYRLEDTPSGKGVALIDATEAEKQAVADALGDKARAVPRNDGALVFSAKHRAKIEAALATAAPAAPPVDPIAQANELMPEGYRLEETASGIALMKPDGQQAGGYLAPSGTRGDTLTRVLKSAQRRVSDLQAMAAKMPASTRKGFVGTTTDGRELVEDENGVRTRFEDGIGITELVELVPVRGRGYVGQPKTPRDPRFLTAEEVSAAAPAADVLAERPGDARTALERAGEGRMKATKAQKAPGSDGGLFDTQDNTGDLFAAPAAPAPAPAPVSTFGANNTRVSADRAAELRAAIKAKLRAPKDILGDERGAFDPELLAMGLELADFYIEGGVRKFADFSKRLADDLGMTMAELKPNLRAWYNGARDTIEDAGGDVEDMDGPGAVKAALAMIPDSVTVNNESNGDNKETENAGPATETALDGNDRGSDEGTGASDALGSVVGGDVAADVERAGGPSDSQLPNGNVGGDDVGDVGGTEPVSGGQRERVDAGAGRGRAPSARTSRRVRGKPADRGSNFLAPAGALKREGNWLTTAQRNLDIIELVNKIEGEGRGATPAEQALLAKFTGWGAGAIRNQLFKNVDRKTMTIMEPASWDRGEWRETIIRARDLLKGEDLRVAMQSVQYAHYTSEGVVRAMWDGLARMGFGGGRILEPGMGIGNFFTAAPASAMETSSYTGIELDAFTARIAKLLLPQENIIGGDFTKQALPDGFFDAAIGNPPFSSLKVMDDPAYKKHRFSLHDYFFAKSIDKVRPGGLLTFITSRYTMDKLDAKARKYIADRADFVGAIRLPQTAFKENAGTEVVTDVLFFQRRAPGAEPGGLPWLSTKEISVGGVKIAVNEYFADNKDMILGKNVTERGQFSANDYSVEPYATGTIESHFAKAIKSLPQDIYTEQPRENAASAQAKAYERDFAPASAKEGGLYVKDGKVLVVDQGSGVPIETISEKLKPNDLKWLADYAPLRDALKAAQKDQLGDGDWEKSHGALVKAYRAFTKKHGRIRDFTSYDRTTTDDEGVETTLTYRRFKWDRLLSLDVEGPLVSQLERITDAGEIIDGPFLLGRTLNKPMRPQIETVEDAMAVTLDEIGKLDLDYVARLAKLSRDEVVERLGDGVFRSPSGDWQTSDEYLSGDVLKKLEEAQAAAVADPDFERNVKALMEVQPAPLAYHNITVKLGAPWLRPETIMQFADEVLGFANLPIKYEPATAHWTVEGAKRWQGRNLTNEYGTDQRSPVELLDAVLNNRSIRIMTPKDSQGKQTTDATATTAAVEAAKKISERFKTWLWEDSARTSEYVETYNRSYNNLAPRRFNGDHLTLPGLSSRYKLHPHQKRAVWRMIQTGNTYLAHAVGAGKTLEMIVGGMEQRRLGLIKKPMYVVPNHMLNQFSSEFLEAYPAANIMVADEKQFHTGNRRRFLAQVSLNDPDAIILTHSSFGKIDTSVQARRNVLDDMIAELEDALESAKDDVKAGAGRHTVSRLEKQIEQLTRRFEGRQGTGKDALLTFDEMGVDYLFIDEAHEFRKLDFATNRVAKGIDSAGSAKALDLFIKTRWLQQRNPGRNLTLASGTAVTNTMAELFTVMRYMAMDGLDRDNIKAFDAWASMFGEVVAGYEQNAAGGYEIVERFAKFVNVPELMKRVREFMDVLTSDQLGDLVVRPKVNGGIPTSMVAAATPALEDFMQGTLNARLETSRKWKPSKDQPGNPDPVINIITDARLASIDMRFVSSGRKPEPTNKLNTMIGKIAEIHAATAGREYLDKQGNKQVRKGATQIVFSAVGFGDQVAASRGFDARAWINEELTRLGVKPGEIGWMSDANSHAKKEQLQKDVRSGKVRILIGSPKNMGTGLNVQDRLIALHYLSPPWYPADVEQPHGRIIRQGNLNPDVDLYWYATKGTYDSTAWGMVSRKQKFIEQAMSGDDSVRTLEDISEASQYEMAAALAAGDDRIIAVAGLSGDIERLQRLKMAHADNQKRLREQIRTLSGFEIPRFREREKALVSANEARGTGYKPFSVTVGGATYDAHGKAGEALLAATQAVIDNSVAVPRTEVARYQGFPVFIAPGERSVVGGLLGFEVDVGGFTAEAGRQFVDLEGKDAVGVMRSIELAVQSIPSLLQDVRRNLTETERELEASEKRYGAPFPEEGQLSDKIAERTQLQSELAAETAAKQAPKASALSEEIDDDVLDMDVEAVWEETSSILEQIIPGDRVALQVFRKLPKENGRSAQGRYWPGRKLIQLGVNIQQSKPWVLGHEALHAMRDMGLFTRGEWKLLVRDAWTNNPEMQAEVRERWAEYDLDEDAMQEEAVAERFGAYVDLALGAVNGKAEAFVQRMFGRIVNVVAAIARAVGKLRGNEKMVTFGEALSLYQRMGSGEIGSRPEGFGRPKMTVTFGKKPVERGPMASAPGTISAAAPGFADPAIEARYLDARKGVGDGPTMRDKARAGWADLANAFTRHWKALPSIPRFADIGQQFRKLEAAPDAAMEASVTYLRNLVGGMDKAEFDLFSRKVILDDLAWEVVNDRDLPFGFNPDTLKAERASIDAAVALSPKVIKAIRDRKTHNKKITSAMVKAGVLSEAEIKNPAYFRHMVLEYARAEQRIARTDSKVKSPYWAKRMGSSKDINANILEAELDWLQKAQIDIATANTIEWIKESPHNIRETLRTQAKATNKAAMDAMIAADRETAIKDAKFRQAMGMGFSLIAKELKDGNITRIPRQHQAAATALENGTKAGDPPFAFLAWMLDTKQPGAMGAGMVLKAMGQRKAWVRDMLGERYLDPEDMKQLVKRLAPEGYKAWQPIEGRHLFTAKTYSEHAVDMFVSNLASIAMPGTSKEEMIAALGPIRQQLVVGGDRYTMVLPEEVADTLTEFGDRQAENLVVSGYVALQSAWKRWVLINPRRFLKYNINNTTGDLDAIIAGNPGTLRQMKKAWGELVAAAKGNPSARYNEALERGVFTSGLSVQEIPDINRLSALRHLTEDRGALNKLTIGAVAKVWRTLQDATNFREGLFRMAAYLDYVEKIERGDSMLEVGYGASVPKMVDSISDPKDKAALLARDLVGDYGNISVAGAGLRKYLIPFWSWTEINAKRYWRLTGNAYSQSKAKGIATGGLLGAGVAARVAVTLGIRMAMVYGMLYLWNHLLFGDEEDDLGDLQKRQMHLILGRDENGEVITLRTQGALSDVLSMLGFPDAMAGFKAYQNGQGSIGQAIKDTIKAPINRIATGTTPIFTVPLEQALGKELWPDIFNARDIKDRARHFADTFTLANEYDQIADKPTRGYARSWQESVIYRRDPGEMAFDTAKGIAYDWLSNVKGQDGGSQTSPRSDALREYRQALRFGDAESADEALIRYEEAGGTDRGLKTSIARQHPLGPIAKKDRAAFLDSLTEEQLETLADAEEWYNRVFLAEPAP